MLKIYRFVGIIAAVASLTACDSTGDPEEIPVDVTNGAIIVNQGSYYANISGSLSYIDFSDSSSNQTAFEAANSGQVLGDTPQSALIYGSKLYVAVYESNLIRVLDSSNFKLIKDIKPDASTGTMPRFMVGAGEKVFVTMYDGYVARIDTTSLTIEASVKVGPNPDGIAVSSGYVYAANSDGMNYENKFANGNTVSKIAISSFTEVEKINVGMNPGAMASADGKVYVIVRGDYETVPSLLKEITSDGTVNTIAPATYLATLKNGVIFIDAPWGVPVDKVSTYTAKEGLSTTSIKAVEYPAAIGFDPVYNLLIITGYNVVNDYPDYMGAGYANLYDPYGGFVAKYDTGINPCFVTFKYTQE